MLMEQIFKTEEGQSISEFFKESAALRFAEVEKLQNDIKDIIVPLKKVNNSMKKNVKDIDLKLIKKNMTTIQTNIQNVKNSTKSSLEILNKDEERLSEEVEAFQQKIQDWNRPSINNLRNKHTVLKKTSSRIPKNISQEVKDFMVYVEANGGHENGWAVDDHNLFLKARSKTKGVGKLAEIIHALLPDISEEEVIAHEKWYQKYSELKERQKNAIKDWRRDKVKANNNIQLRTENNSSKYSEKNVLNSYSDCINKEIQQQKIAEWKAQKRMERANKHKQKLQEQMRKRELEKIRKQKQEEIKAEVDNWRHTKNAAEEAKKLEQVTVEFNERKNRAAKANKLIKLYQSQDDQFLQRKIQMRLIQPKSAEIETIKIKHEAVRDPERLFKPTRQWILRTYGGDNNESTTPLHLQTIPKLRIPEWRKGII
ncbi:hypothetical protein ILUMI_12283 [Ignelater luminosus]|uniref:Coiled-coil domain-containing protein 112-like n=1 Tax=Ignelater luminosus TaxID=2038154 RepID=A0A8K0D370_IGNLU|nr:hypothetical protein ILUMI_12283 [Ignelater luminosus]